jgi:anti-sigma factor RsiW
METDFRDSACSGYEALLEEYFAGELSGADARKTAAHVESCAGCRSALEDAAASVLLLRGAAALLDDAPVPSPGFARMVMARARNEEAAVGASFWQPFVSLAWRFAATATLALAVLLTYAVAGFRRPRAEIAALSPAEMHDIFSPDPTSAPADRDEVLMMVGESGHANN